ncbi:hypothetical protein HELRODRAFT_171906 [Helobdella robusta]|uniref:Apple domain-containing protein n=1 Tax=Helobdella robusta TaxID=6412 RepID=T1F4T7_HELRO|nr:hypothetical protein HELRODRAFT_171906 [Helobdella robusta]ESO04904.1 hypothetical protein HELRODRAFT_171906 [Helobdella robusta]
MYRREILMIYLQIGLIVAKIKCFRSFKEDDVRFFSCDKPMEHTSLSLMLCSMRCSQTTSCVAYNFFNATNQCQLFNQTLNKFSVLPGCQYYLRKASAADTKYQMIGVPDKPMCFVSEPTTVLSNIRSLLECSAECSRTTCNAFNYVSNNANDPAKYCQLFNFNCEFEFKTVSNVSNCKAYKAVLKMSVDDELKELYVNGLNIPVVPATFPNALLWNVPDTYKLTCRVLYVLAMKGWNNGYYGGFVASTADDYILTNSTWKCSMTYYEGWYEINYNDSLWSAAYYGSAQGDSDINSQLSAKAKWIIDSTDCLDCIFYCRKTTELLRNVLFEAENYNRRFNIFFNIPVYITIRYYGNVVD